MDAPFHPGEMALQEATGVRARLAQAGSRVIRDFMPQQHRDFFGQLPFLVLGALDAYGQPWATLLEGEPGFVSSPDEKTLRVQAGPIGLASLREGDAVGLLGIEPHTRRRNRANGRVRAGDAEGFELAVEQSFGNCPKYIHEREARFAAPRPAGDAIVSAAGLDARARELLRKADTFFIATAHPMARSGRLASQGVDVSHRGGPAGFVHVTDEGALLVPDYVGNFYFNTLGNLRLEPRCGLLFIDFPTGDLLQVAARAQLVSDARDVSRFEGAQRLLRFEVDSARLLPSASRLNWRRAGT